MPSISNKLITKIQDSIRIGSWFLVFGYSASKKQAGFTLIEILVTITVISVASLLILPNFRNFGNEQLLVDSGSGLLNTLRQAQSSAQNGAICTNGGSKYYILDFTSPANGYKLICVWGDPVENQMDIVRTSTQTNSNITLTADCSQITFRSNYITFSGTENQNVCTITILDTKKNKSFVVGVNRGGSIYQQSAEQ